MSKDGGPAFPAVRISYGTGLAGSDERVYRPGMSLRAWFAGQVLKGLASDPNLSFGTVEKPYNPWEWCAKEAVRAADAILKELEVPPP